MDGLVQPGIWLDCDAPTLIVPPTTPIAVSGQPLPQSVYARILDLISEG